MIVDTLPRILFNENSSMSLIEESEANIKEIQRLKAHFANVCETLENRKQNEKRSRAVNILREYRAQGQFPRVFSHPNVVPCFIDDVGTYCAVGHLMKLTGYNELALSINISFKFSFVHEIVSGASSDQLQELQRFARDNDLTVEELAFIQPTYSGIRTVQTYDSPSQENMTAHQEQHQNLYLTEQLLLILFNLKFLGIKQ